MKIADPIIPPATIIVLSKSPSPRVNAPRPALTAC
jgi:hypothetical protein